MSRGGIRGRLSKLTERIALLDIDRCEDCGGPVPYEAAAVVVRRHPDGREELLGDYCTTCWQPMDDQGRGKGWPMPGKRAPQEAAPIVRVVLESSPTQVDLPR